MVFTNIQVVPLGSDNADETLSPPEKESKSPPLLLVRPDTTTFAFVDRELSREASMPLSLLHDAAEAILRGDEIAPSQELTDVLQAIIRVSTVSTTTQTEKHRACRPSIAAYLTTLSDAPRSLSPLNAMLVNSLNAVRDYLPLGPEAAEKLRGSLQKALVEYNHQTPVHPTTRTNQPFGPTATSPVSEMATQEMRALSLNVGLQDALWESNVSDNSIYNSSRRVRRASDFISHSWRDNGRRKTQMLRSFLFLQEYIATVLAGTVLAWLLIAAAHAQGLFLDITIACVLVGSGAALLIIWACAMPLGLGPFVLSSRTIWLDKAWCVTCLLRVVGAIASSLIGTHVFILQYRSNRRPDESSRHRLPRRVFV